MQYMKYMVRTLSKQTSPLIQSMEIFRIMNIVQSFKLDTDSIYQLR